MLFSNNLKPARLDEQEVQFEAAVPPAVESFGACLLHKQLVCERSTRLPLVGSAGGVYT